MVTFTGDDVRALCSHSTHQHALKPVDTEKVFGCDGCRQLGDGLRFRCEQCDFDLHVCCAQAPARIVPSMFDGRALTFFNSRPATATHAAGIIPLCDVCGEPVRGFLYHNREHDTDLHPVCAVLPKRTSMGEDDGRMLELHKAAGHKCGLCGSDGQRGWFMSYRFQRDDGGQPVHVHVACLMEANYSPPPNAPAPATAPAPRGRTGTFKRVCKVAFIAARVSYAVTTLNPVGVVTAFL